MLPRLLTGLALATVLPFSLALTTPLAPRGRTRQFDLTVTWAKGSPNGVKRDMILINGQFPGPTIEVDEGDEVVVTARNRLPFNTTIHYHGM